MNKLMTPTFNAPRRKARWWHAAILACAASAALAAPGPAAPFEPETLKDGMPLPADMPRVYVADFAIAHLMDGRIHVLDGRNGNYVGLIDGGFAGHFAPAPGGGELYLATTYLSRHTHGQRQDVVEIYDPATLRMTGDVVLPPKRAQSAYQQFLTRPSYDGHYLFVQNATPATSISVVDLRTKTLLTEVPTPGCWGIYPALDEPLRVSMLCGDGKLATVTLAADGTVKTRATSAKFFDAAEHPVFMPSVAYGGKHYFLSFKGELIRTDLRGAEPVFENAVSFVSAADRKAGWRPGGYQLMALDAARKQVYVGMHPKGGEGSHKTPAQEIWTIDLASGVRSARAKARNAIALAVGARGPGYLYAIDAVTNQLVAYQLPGMRQVFASKPFGEAILQIDAP